MENRMLIEYRNTLGVWMPVGKLSACGRIASAANATGNASNPAVQDVVRSIISEIQTESGTKMRLSIVQESRPARRGDLVVHAGGRQGIVIGTGGVNGAWLRYVCTVPDECFPAGYVGGDVFHKFTHIDGAEVSGYDPR